ncbi:MAG: MFS transporter [Rhizomicrobium sp.]
MVSQLSSISAILLSALVFYVGNGLLTTLIPVRAHLEGFSTLVIGVIGSAYYIGFVMGCFLSPRLLARVGHVRSFSVGAGAVAALALLQSIWVAPGIWIFTRAIYGFGVAGLFMVLESWLNDRASNANRGQIFSAYTTVNFGGIMLGQALFATSPPQGFTLFALGAICCALSLIPVGMTALSQPLRPPVPVLQPGKLFRISPVGVAGCVAAGLANGALWALLPIYGIERGLSGILLSLFLVVFSLGGTLVQAPVGRLSDHMDRRYVIAGCCLLASFAGLSMALLPLNHPYLLLLNIAVLGVLMLPLYGLSVAHANDRIPRKDFVESTATLLLINALASTVGPTVAAIVMGWFGPRSLFFFTATIHMGMLIFALVRLGIVHAPGADHRDRFKFLPDHVSPGALSLDPRGERPAPRPDEDG